MEMDASKFDTDTQLRYVLHKVAEARASNQIGDPLKRVAKMTEEYDV